MLSSGTGTFTTGTGNITLNGNITVASGKNIALHSTIGSNNGFITSPNAQFGDTRISPSTTGYLKIPRLREKYHNNISLLVAPINHTRMTDIDYKSVPALALTRYADWTSKNTPQAVFNIGSYSNSTHAKTLLTLSMIDGGESFPDKDVISFLANGRVGIGTSAPKTTLHVSSTANGTIDHPQLGSYHGVGIEGGVQDAIYRSNIADAESTDNVTIYTDGFILSTQGITIISDSRTKNILGISNQKEDLKNLMNLEVTNYHQKDSRNFDKKVIAQQVEKYIPHAVKLGLSDFVGDIYRLAKSIRKA